MDNSSYMTPCYCSLCWVDKSRCGLTASSWWVVQETTMTPSPWSMSSLNTIGTWNRMTFLVCVIGIYTMDGIMNSEHKTTVFSRLNDEQFLQ